jgi:hypothetical protein
MVVPSWAASRGAWSGPTADAVPARQAVWDEDLGLTLAVIGAGLGALTTRRAVPNDPS